MCNLVVPGEAGGIWWLVEIGGSVGFCECRRFCGILWESVGLGVKM